MISSCTDWVVAGQDTLYAGGQWIDVAAPLETIPVFLKADSNLQNLFQSGRT